MSINYIDNLEDGLSIRTKLNDLITIVNYYSSSQWPPSPSPTSYTRTIYDNSPTTPSGLNDSTEACNAYNNNSHIVYNVKGSGNVNTMVIENNDILYQDSELTTYVQFGYYSYYNSQLGQSNYIQVGAGGMIMSSGACSGGGGGTTSTSIYSTMMASPMPSANPTDACNAISSGFIHTVYFSKGAGNVGAELESGDYLYQDSGATSVLSSGYYGFVQTAMNKWILLGPGGVVESITFCA